MKIKPIGEDSIARTGKLTWEDMTRSQRRAWLRRLERINDRMTARLARMAEADAKLTESFRRFDLLNGAVVA